MCPTVGFMSSGSLNAFKGSTSSMLPIKSAGARARLWQTSAMTVKIRVLVVDDHVVVRMGLASLINCEPDMEVVAQAANGVDAIAAYRSSKPDVVLMDLRMPELGGEDAIRVLINEDRGAKIVALSSFSEPEQIYRTFNAGAKGYLLKNLPAPEITDALRSVYQGHKAIPAAVAAQLKDREARAELTPREKDIVKLIGHGKSNREIAEAFGLTEGTVKSYVVTILGKLEANDRTQAVTEALRRGFITLD